MLVQVFAEYTDWMQSWDGDYSASELNRESRLLKWNRDAKCWEGTVEQVRQFRAVCEEHMILARDYGNNKSATALVACLRDVIAAIDAGLEKVSKPAPRSWTNREKRVIVAEYRAAARGTKHLVLAKHSIHRSYIYRWEKSLASQDAVRRVRQIFRRGANEQAKAEYYRNVQTQTQAA